HRAQEIAVADAVSHHAEHRREQSAEILQRCKYGEQQHGPGLDQHVPAEDERLHLEGPRGRHVGGPLEAETTNAKWRERRHGRRGAHQIAFPAVCPSAVASSSPRGARQSPTSRTSMPAARSGPASASVGTRGVEYAKKERSVINAAAPP